MLLVQFIILNVVVFAAIAFFLRKMLYSDTQSAINRLDRVYQDLLEKQKDLQQKIEAAEKEFQQKKEEAAQISSKMQMETMDQMRQKKDEMLKTAREEAEEVLKKARASVEKQTFEIEKKIKREMIDTAVEFLHSALTEKMIQGIHHDLVKDFLERGKKLDFSNIDPNLERFTVKSALPLAPEEKSNIDTFIVTKLNRKVPFDESVDPKILAGIVFEFGSLLMDGSMSNFLKEGALREKERIEKSA
jgi:F-type H+-transporting ATPase subunit b